MRVIDEKSYKNILVYNKTGYLVLIDSEKYDFICKKSKKIIRVKSCITYVISLYYAIIKLIHMILCL